MVNKNVKEEAAAVEEREAGSGNVVDDAVRTKIAEDKVKERLQVKLGQDVFYRKKESGEIVAAKIVHIGLNRKVAVVWWSEATIGKSAGEKNVSMGLSRGCVWPDLEELQIAVELEKSRRAELTS